MVGLDGDPLPTPCPPQRYLEPVNVTIFNICFSFWLLQVLSVHVQSLLGHVGSSSLTRDQTWAPSMGSSGS